MIKLNNDGLNAHLFPLQVFYTDQSKFCTSAKLIYMFTNFFILYVVILWKPNFFL